MIICEGLTKTFGTVTAIDNFTLTIPDGQVFGLLGPNGAGKTTTMRMLSSLIAPTTGTAIIDNYNITRKQDAQHIRHIIGLLPEVPGLYETLGSYKNLDYYAQFYGISKQKREQSIQNTLKNLGLWERRNEPVNNFSKGMKQKLAIARALIHEPKYIFLDEPTASLDPQAAKTVREYIIQLRSQGNTILINTHNLSEAERICDHVALVKNRLIRTGKPKELARSLFSRIIRVTVNQIPSRLTDSMTSIPDVSMIRTEGNQLLLTVKNPEVTNPNIISWLTQHGVQVQYVSEEEHSLEDVYLKLIAEG